MVEGEGREMEVCKGRSKAGNSEEDIFVLMDSALCDIVITLHTVHLKF